jgi:hypothetical protein
MFAEAVGELLDDQGLRSRMAFRGRQRLRDFDEDAATTSFLEQLAKVV